MDDGSTDELHDSEFDDAQSTRKLSPDEMDRLVSPDRQGPHLPANVAAHLKHPGIVPIHEVGESQGNYYFTMEYVEGQTLAKHLETHELSRKEKLDLFRRICEIVTHAHILGVIHRDLKPSNIMIDKDGGPRILDFGLAKMTEMGPDEHRSFVTMSGVVVGTLAYMSPEQTLGKPEEIDTRSDVHSLGVIRYLHFQCRCLMANTRAWKYACVR